MEDKWFSVEHNGQTSHRTFFWLIAFFISIGIVACTRGPGLKTPAETVVNQNSPSSPREEEEFQFPKGTIKIGGKTINVEFANTPRLRERGLMFREALEEDHGMLFMFPQEERLAFWMKNTLIPLSIGYFNRDRKLVDVQEMVPAVIGDEMPPSYPSKAPAMYALEMPKGWFTRNKVDIGAEFTIINGP